MDFSLFDQNVVVILAIIVAGVDMFIITHLRQRWFQRRGLYVLGAALLTTGVIEEAIQLYYASDKLPTLLWLMLLPFTLGGALIIPAWKNKRRWLKWLAAGAGLLGLVFSLVIINGYYRFYPTLYSLFNPEDANQIQTQTTVSYTVSVNKGKASTIESSLYSSSSSTKGQVYSLTIPGTVSRFQARKAWVYVPAIADSPGRLNLPVVVMTPGIPGLPSNWLSSGLEQTMDQFAHLHHGITPIVFMVDNTGSLTNDTECVNSPRGNVETYLTVDVPNYIKAHYEVSGNPANWAIGGSSMGGMCGVMLTLRHPNVYHYFLDFGGESGPEVGSKQTTIDKLFYGSETAWAAHQPWLLLPRNHYQNLGGFFAVGTGDKTDLINGMNQLYQQSKTAGIESIYEKVGGQHSYTVWQQAYKDALPWLSNRLGATECASSCTQ